MKPNIPTSSTSEDTGVVVTSSPELYAEHELALLDGKSIGVTSALLTSPVTLGSEPARRLCSVSRQTFLLSVDRRVQHCARGVAERERVVEEENTRNQTTMTAQETRHKRNDGRQIQEDTKKAKRDVPFQALEPHARVCLRVFCARGAVCCLHGQAQQCDGWAGASEKSTQF